MEVSPHVPDDVTSSVVIFSNAAAAALIFLGSNSVVGVLLTSAFSASPVISEAVLSMDPAGLSSLI